MTSFDVIRCLKKLYPGVKFGHLGTLDPMAEGVLPVALGYAGRLIEYIQDKSKVYLLTMVLGGVSDTQDAWGNIEYTGNSAIEIERLEEEVKSFTGVIKQTPPMYSAVHYQGQRLYDLARKGIIVERQAREVEISSLQIMGININSDKMTEVRMKVECSEGTYIRTLCHDIGQQLGTGAYMSQLVRSQWGVFSIDKSVCLDEISENPNRISEDLFAVDYPLQDIDEIIVEEKEELYKINNGNFITKDGECPSGLLKVYNQEGRLLAIARREKAGHKKNIIKPLKVFK